MAVSSLRGWAWYLLVTVQWLSLLTKAFRWDISVVSSCSFEKRFVNGHFELNIQYWQQPGISGRPITSPVFTHPVVSEPCSLCSEVIHSSYTKWKPICVESTTCWPFSTSLDIVKTSNFDISCCKKMIASRATVFGISCSPSPFLIALATGRSGISSPGNPAGCQQKYRWETCLWQFKYTVVLIIVWSADDLHSFRTPYIVTKCSIFVG